MLARLIVRLYRNSSAQIRRFRGYGWVFKRLFQPTNDAKRSAKERADLYTCEKDTTQSVRCPIWVRKWLQPRPQRIKSKINTTLKFESCRGTSVRKRKMFIALDPNANSKKIFLWFWVGCRYFCSRFSLM